MQSSIISFCRNFTKKIWDYFWWFCSCEARQPLQASTMIKFIFETV